MALCICAFILTGCKVGPDYQRQQMQISESWTGSIVEPNQAPKYINLANWWTEFDDPNMSSLISRAIESNLDLRQAEMRILQARAQRGIVASGLFPTASATGSVTRSRSPGLNGSPASTDNLFRTGLDAAWELDVFGGTRRSIEAADAQIEFAVEDMRDILVTLVSEVALNYVDLRGFQQEIAIARSNLAAQQHSAELTRKRYLGGFVGSLDVANAEAQVATTASVIPGLEASAQQTIYNMGILLGSEPSRLLKELSSPSGIPGAVPEVPIGIPSDLLRRRPDIRRAEALIHISTANIGVAVSDLFPKFNLVGSLNFQNDQLRNLVNWSNRSWSIGPGIDWQIFTAGRVRSNIKLQEAIRQEDVLVYQRTVLVALQDVENSFDRLRERRPAPKIANRRRRS